EAGARSVARRYSWTRTVDDFIRVAEEAVRPPQPAAVPRTVRPNPAPSRPLHVSRGRPEVSVVVPALNEGVRLRHSLPQLTAALADRDAEIIVVDDGSTDDTAAIAAEALSHDDRSRVVRLPRHQGKGAAVRTGVAEASGHSIVFMDADLATDLSHLPDALAALDDHHVVI